MHVCEAMRSIYILLEKNILNFVHILNTSNVQKGDLLVIYPENAVKKEMALYYNISFVYTNEGVEPGWAAVQLSPTETEKND